MGFSGLTYKAAGAALSALNIEYGVPSSAVSTAPLLICGTSRRDPAAFYSEKHGRSLSRRSRDRDTIRNDRHVNCFGVGTFKVFLARGEQRPARYHTFGRYFLRVLTD
jgi:hypothetical protein